MEDDEMDISVMKLGFEINTGDWHDKPLRWAVIGPDGETQNFSTKADAIRYRRIRKKSASFADASREFVLTV